MPITLNDSSLDNRRLVELHLAGDGSAFRQIVERHQAMVCALSLSACGDVGRSEDLAQEVFVAAWKQLPELREPEKLRGWLAGIARNLTHNSFRQQHRTPTARAEPLSLETPSDEGSPRDHAISADEAALMWSALERIPENYREPMVLYYREHRSVPAVAAALEISEETVRQRLARGRAMLSERMAAIIGETLERTGPTPGFSSAVLLALPLGAEPWVREATLDAGQTATKATAAAGGVVAMVAKGGFVVKALALFAVVPALLDGATSYLRFRAKHEALGTDSERRRMALAYVAFQGALGVAIVGALIGSNWLHTVTTEVWPHLLLGAIVAVAALIALRMKLRLDRELEPRAPLFSKEKNTTPARRGFEYGSAATLLGMRLVQVRLGTGQGWRGPVVKAWIAVSDGRAVGGLFASGLLAVAPLSLGVLAVGGLGLGLFAVGGWAVGGITAGWLTEGVFGAGGRAAHGGLVVAGEYANGYLGAFAPQANNAAAAALFREQGFFQSARLIWNGAVYAGWFGWVVPLVLMSRRLLRKK